MKLSDYAKKKGISYDTAWRMWNRGQLQGERLPTGTIIIFEDDRSCGENKGLFGNCYAMDGGYKGWNPYIERHLAIFVNYF
jgi:hypothetical protein